MELTQFNHSVKVPQTYRDVSKVLKKVIGDGLGLKHSIYENVSKSNRNKQRCLCLASKVLEKSKTIEHVLNTTEILSKEPSLNPWLARVLIHELVWRKDLNYECKPAQTVLKYKEEILKAVASFKEKPTKKGTRPKYIRINTARTALAPVIAYLRNEGFILLPRAETYNEHLDIVSNLTPEQFIVDFHIKDMLVFEPKFDFFIYDYYKDGTFAVQDKASCLPPFLLDPPKGSVVLDMCAAPGMKTNFYANMVGSKGRVYAVERNKERYQTLSKMINTQGLQNVKCMLQDASKLTGDDLPDVEYIAIDPSCSGSGMVSRINYEKSEERLKNLAGFQTLLLHRALINFPNVKRVVYSTCSIHPEENEEVVSAVLNIVKDFQLVNLQEKMKENWNHFGSEKYGNIGTSCLYADSEKDLTNGFFVAVFERIPHSGYKKRKLEKYEQSQDFVEETEVVKEMKKTQNNENNIERKKKNKRVDLDMTEVVTKSGNVLLRDGTGVDRKNKNINTEKMKNVENLYEENNIREKKKQKKVELDATDVVQRTESTSVTLQKQTDVDRKNHNINGEKMKNVENLYEENTIIQKKKPKKVKLDATDVAQTTGSVKVTLQKPTDVDRKNKNISGEKMENVENLYEENNIIQKKRQKKVKLDATDVAETTGSVNVTLQKPTDVDRKNHNINGEKIKNVENLYEENTTIQKEKQKKVKLDATD